MNPQIPDIRRAERLFLWKPEGWYCRSRREKAECYNGVGADRFPAAVRWLLTIVNPLFLPAVVIHDFDYTYYKGGYWGFTVSNLRLAVNMILCCIYTLFALHKWFCVFCTLLNILLAPLKILIYPLICQLFGYSGYCKRSSRKRLIFPELPTKSFRPLPALRSLANPSF